MFGLLFIMLFYYAFILIYILLKFIFHSFNFQFFLLYFIIKILNFTEDNFAVCEEIYVFNYAMRSSWISYFFFQMSMSNNNLVTSLFDFNNSSFIVLFNSSYFFIYASWVPTICLNYAFSILISSYLYYWALISSSCFKCY